MSWWDWEESAFEKYTRETLGKIYREVLEMAQELEGLKAQIAALVESVDAERTVIDAATMAINGLTEQQAILVEELQAAIEANDPEAIQDAANAIQEQNEEIIVNTAALAAAIPNNTVSKAK